MDLSPQFAANLLESVTDAGISGADLEIPPLPSARRLPLFRQAAGRRRPDPESLAEDCRKLLASRGPRMRREDGSVLECHVLCDLEEALARKDPLYAPGHLLSLVRLGQDLADTAIHGTTAIESRSLHLLERRLSDMQESERPARPEWVAACLALLRSGEPWRRTALLDLMRYLEEVTGHPLVGFPEQVASDAIHLLLAIQHATTAFAAGTPGLVPLDVCLGARCVLANERVLHPRLGALLDHVLSPELPMWEALARWVAAIEHDDPPVFALHAELLDATFVVEGRPRRPLDLVLSVGSRLARTGKTASTSESLVALERTLYRRIYRQESAKHHMAVLLRRHLDRAIHEKNRSSMRLIAPSSAGVRARPAAVPDRTAEDPVWPALRRQAELLESSRDRGCSPAASRVWTRLFGCEPEASDPLHDLDEFLRWTLDIRSDLEQGMATVPSEARPHLALWFEALSERASGIQATHPGGVSMRRGQILRTSPLLWLVAARRLVQVGGEARDMVTHAPDPNFFARADGHVPAALRHWRALHPWDCGLFGVWPPELRGPRFAEGLRAGMRRAQAEQAPPAEIQVRLEMLAHELDYRAWLGAKERVALLHRTLEPA